MNQDPVAGYRPLAVRVEQADVDRPLNTGNVDLGEAVRLVDDLDDLPWNCQADKRPLLSLVARRGRTVRPLRGCGEPQG